AKVESDVTSYFLSDRLSARLTLDGSGNVVGRQAHLPFGEDFAESGTQQKQHFTSYERDSESGTDYAVNRQYNQSIGIFNRVDPYSGSNDISNPQSLNRYAYAENDPIDRADPLGLYPWSIIDLGNGQTAFRFCFSIGENSWCEWRVISEFEPRGKGPQPCPGHTKAPLTGKALKKYTAGHAIIADKLQNSGPCKSYLMAHGVDPGKALDAVNLQRPYDGSRSEISRLEAGLELLPVDLDNDSPFKNYLNSCVSNKFKFRGSNLRTETAIYPDQRPTNETTVAERSDVYYGQTFSAATILHEALHSLFGIEDPELAAKLNVDISQKGSAAISDALQKHGCGD
ncbi:MAG: hypothetical protein V7641_717, partial [Blastocatellia bacterium]